MPRWRVPSSPGLASAGDVLASARTARSSPRARARRAGRGSRARGRRDTGMATWRSELQSKFRASATEG